MLVLIITCFYKKDFYSSKKNRILLGRPIFYNTNTKIMGKEKITELTYANLTKMDKNTFGKLVKKPIIWQKAKGVLLFAKQKMTNGKLPLVAIPFKKYTAASKCFKEEVKKAPNYTAKLTLLVSFEWKKGLDGNMGIILTPIQGAMNLDYAQACVRELFAKMNVDVNVVGAADKLELNDLKEVNTASGETTSDKKTQKTLKERNLRLSKIKKVTEKLGKFEKSIGRVDLLLLEEKVVLFENILFDIMEEASKDRQLDSTEGAEIDRLKAHLDEVKTQLANQTANPKKSLTTAQRNKMFAGLDKMEKYIDQVLKKHKLAV